MPKLKKKKKLFETMVTYIEYTLLLKIPGLHTDVFPDFDGHVRSNAYQQVVLTCTHTGTKSPSDNAETNL